MGTLYQVEDIQFKYSLGVQSIQALRGLSCKIDAGDFVCLSGPSGSGKSTFVKL